MLTTHLPLLVLDLLLLHRQEKRVKQLTAAAVSPTFAST
jgi:hypothetical protein